MVSIVPAETDLQNIDIVESLVKFSDFGKKTERVNQSGIPYFVNEYWTPKQREGHSLHEISYRACFKPQLPSFFIKRLTDEGDIVHDPFMGRGTTPLEAWLNNRIASGNDINPLSLLLTRPRLNPPTYRNIEMTLESLVQEASQCNDEKLDDNLGLTAFFHPKTLQQLSRIRDFFQQEVGLQESNPDLNLDWIRMVCINRLTGHSPGFFSGRTMPPNQAISAKSQRILNERSNLVPPERDIKSIILRKSKSLLRHSLPLFSNASSQYYLSIGPASKTPNLKSNSVSLVVTSPPFLDVVDYAKDNWLRCWFAGISDTELNIAIHKKPEDWTEMTHEVLAEQARILKPGGHIAFEVGEVRRGTILLESLVLEAAKGLPFEVLGVMVNLQKFTKTSNCWGIVNGSRGTNTNRIVLLRKF